MTYRDPEPEPCAGDDRFTSELPDERLAATKVCATCPLMDKCLAGAKQRGETWGVWGGTDMSPGTRAIGTPAPHAPCPQCGKAMERRSYESYRQFRKRTFCDQECRKAHTAAGKLKKPIVHGTEGGARTHQRRGEKPCTLCAVAAQRAKNRREPGHAA